MGGLSGAGVGVVASAIPFRLLPEVQVPDLVTKWHVDILQDVAHGICGRGRPLADSSPGVSLLATEPLLFYLVEAPARLADCNVIC